MGSKNLAPPTGIRSPSRPARNESLYRLRHPAIQAQYLKKLHLYMKLLNKKLIAGTQHKQPLWTIISTNQHNNQLAQELSKHGKKKDVICFSRISSDFCGAWRVHGETKHARLGSFQPLMLSSWESWPRTPTFAQPMYPNVVQNFFLRCTFSDTRNISKCHKETMQIAQSL